MKIVVVSIFRREFGGGEGQIAHEMADVFSSRHDVTLICPGDRTELQERENGLKVFTVQSASHEHVSSPLLSQVNLRALYSYLDAFQPDVIHAHDPALLGVVLQVWAKTHQVPFIYTTHVLPSKATQFGTTDALRVNLDFIARPLINRFLMNFYENCDGVIALNQIAFNEVREFGFHGPMFIIPNGRVLAHYAYRRIADPEDAVINLIAIGFLSPRKNQAYLIDVMQYLPDHFMLQFVGPALSPDYERALHKHAQMVAPSRIEFLGKLPHQQIAELLENAHLLLSASTMEVQSLVVIEALASGTPIVGLSNETIDELVDDRVGLRLQKTAPPEAMAEAVLGIFSGASEDYQQYCMMARERVQHLDWSNVMDQTIDLYRKIQSLVALTYPPVPSHRRIASRILANVRDLEWKQTLLDLSSNLPLPSLPRHRVSMETRMISGITHTGAIMLYAAIKADRAFRSLPRRFSRVR